MIYGWVKESRTKAKPPLRTHTPGRGKTMYTVDTGHSVGFPPAGLAPGPWIGTGPRGSVSVCEPISCGIPGRATD